MGSPKKGSQSLTPRPRSLLLGNASRRELLDRVKYSGDFVGPGTATVGMKACHEP